MESQPEPCTTPHAERQRQALMGYDRLSDSTDRQYLRLYVHSSSQTGELRLGADEFQTLANCLPMATACKEARSHAVKFCSARPKCVDFFRILEDQLPEGKSILKPVFTHITTVTVTTARFQPEVGPEGFDSPEQLLDLVSRVFGSGVEKIIWSALCAPGFSMSDIYWPHTPQLEGLHDK